MHPHRKDTAVRSQLDMHAVNLGGWCCPSRSQKAAVVGPAPGSCLASGSHTGHQDTQTLLCSPAGRVPHQQSRHGAPAGLFREKGLCSLLRSQSLVHSLEMTGTAPHGTPAVREVSERRLWSAWSWGANADTPVTPETRGQSPPLQAEPPAALAHKTPWGLQGGVWGGAVTRGRRTGQDPHKGRVARRSHF